METNLSNSTAHLIDRIWQHLLSYVPSTDVVAKYRDQWLTIAEIPTARFVIFGAYDAGKSSLLKRLLVDSGSPVPDWVVISARRETFESAETRAGSITFIDTPGLGSGNAEHDTITRKTLQLADAYIWVMPPQLVTSGQSDYVSLISGRFFHPKLPATALKGVTVAVISRMDEAGVDPGDSPDGYAGQVEKKLQELASMLSKDDLAKNVAVVHCVVADPYQMVGNMSDPDRSMYDIGRDWDGIAALETTLHSLEKDKPRLRELSGLRFVYSIAAELEEAVRAQSGVLKLQAERFDNDSQRYALFSQRLQNQAAHAEMDLRGRIEEALRPTAQADLEDIHRVLEQLEATLAETIGLWATDSTSTLQRLAQEIELEIRESNSRLDIGSLLNKEGFAAQASNKDGAESGSFSQHSKRLFGFLPVLGQSVKKLAESDIGMSIEEARVKLGELVGLTGDELKDAIAKIFKSKEAMEKASSYVRWTSAITALAPLVTELASVGTDLLQQHLSQQQIEAGIQKRESLQRQLDKNIGVIREQALRLYTDSSRALDQQLLARQQECVEAKQEVLDQRLQAETFLTGLTALLD